MNRRKSKEETLNDLKDELVRLGSTKRSVYDSQKSMGQKSSSAICRYLNMSWREVVALIGLQPQRKLLPQEEQIKSLRKEFERIGSYSKVVFVQKRNKEKFPNPSILCKYLGMSWYEITKACGREDVVGAVNDTVTDEELIQEYMTLSEKIGRPLTVRELKKYTNYSFEIYRQHFGTISKLRLICGYEATVRKNTITKEECVQELFNLYIKYGKTLSYKETKELSDISMSTVFRKFHTTKINEIWREVLEEKAKS